MKNIYEWKDIYAELHGYKNWIELLYKNESCLPKLLEHCERFTIYFTRRKLGEAANRIQEQSEYSFAQKQELSRIIEYPHEGNLENFKGN